MSTVAEAEHLAADFDVFSTPGTETFNILYGLPLPPSQAERLGYLAHRCGKGSISLLVDNIAQLESLATVHRLSGHEIGLYVKIDTGYHRAGLRPDSSEVKDLLTRIVEETEPSGKAYLEGFYSHAGHSYAVDSRAGAMSLLILEIEGLVQAAKEASTLRFSRQDGHPRRFVLSVGATPTATSVQNLDCGTTENTSWHRESAGLKKCIDGHRAAFELEIHAGVYPILDMQQLATAASPSAVEASGNISAEDIALTILTEVASVYPGRETPEALIAAGSLALGREPCKSYTGWGVLSAWGLPAKSSGWMVGRISQEHGMLTTAPGTASPCDLHVGDKVRIWPNHACVAGAGYGWYLVVDSSLPEDQRDKIVDVWIRWRGW